MQYVQTQCTSCNNIYVESYKDLKEAQQDPGMCEKPCESPLELTVGQPFIAQKTDAVNTIEIVFPKTVIPISIGSMALTFISQEGKNFTITYKGNPNLN